MELSVKELIVVHVCYRDVFNAPVSIEDLKGWIGVKSSGQEELLNDTLSELKREELIIIKEGYVATFNKEGLIDRQFERSLLADNLIKEHTPLLTLLGRLPLVQFIGISGSLAAKNPTPDKREGLNDGMVDMDLFIITSKNSLWIFVLLERFYSNLRRIFRKYHFYCFNYITDESFLEVYNRNFYTATEVVNLKPIVNKGVYQEFLAKNSWLKNFYPNGRTSDFWNKRIAITKYISYILWIPNSIGFLLFHIFRSIKRLDPSILQEIKIKFDPNYKFNLKRVSSPKGGYQEMIRINFEKRLKELFQDYYSPKLMRFLFPKESLFEFDELDPYDKEHAKIFEKY